MNECILGMFFWLTLIVLNISREIVPGDKVILDDVESVFCCQKLGVLHNQVFNFPAHTLDQNSDSEARNLD